MNIYIYTNQLHYKVSSVIILLRNIYQPRNRLAAKSLLNNVIDARIIKAKLNQIKTSNVSLIYIDKEQLLFNNEIIKIV